MRLDVLVFTLLVSLAGSAHAQTLPCDDLRELNSVYFGFARATLSEDAEERLAENLSLLLPCPELGVAVEAYADDVEALVDPLSRLRAETVAAWYLAQGMDADRVAARGLGEDPSANAIEDSGPGDSRARRASSTPMPVVDLPAEAMAWTDAGRTDPDPFEQELAEGVTLTLDWDLLGKTRVIIASARLDAFGQTWTLPTSGLTVSWPGTGLVGGAVAEAAPGVYVVSGTVVSGDRRPFPLTWAAGPDGATLSGLDVCAESETHDAALGMDLRALAEASRRGDAAEVARATEAAAVNGSSVMNHADLGGSTALVLDCTPLPHRHDH